MTQNPSEPNGPSLYEESAPVAPAEKAPGLAEQLMGVFTEPTALFRKLHRVPSWGWALGTSLAVAVLLTVIWGLKVDVDAMLRPMLESNPQVPADQIDRIIEMQGRFILPFGILQVVLVMPVITLFMALLYWLIGMGTGEAGRPSYLQAFSATTVSGLVLVPQMLATILVCLLKPVGGLTPDKLSPTSVGYFLTVENVRLGALLRALDPFVIGSFVVFYLAARHTMRLKPIGAALCTVVAAIFMVGFRVAFAR